MISVATKRKQCLLLSEVCLEACFRGGGAAPPNDFAPEHFLFVFSPNPEMLSLHREEEQREQGGLYWEASSCGYCCVVLCTH